MLAQESTCLMQLLKDLNQPTEHDIPLYCANLSAIRLAKNPIFHATKHVEVHYHFIREKVLKEEIKLEYISTENQAANLFTKGLSSSKCANLCHQLGMVERLEASVKGEC